MQCPICPADVPSGASVCDHCLVMIRHDGDRLVAVHPSIRPGDVIFQRNYLFDDLIGERKTADGYQIDIEEGRSATFTPLTIGIRDVCMRAYLRADAGGADLTLAARNEELADASTKYGLRVSPTSRSIALRRYFSADDEAGSTRLAGQDSCAAVAPVGAWNLLEMRLMGPTIEGWVNNVQVAVVHDPVLGFGQVSFGVVGSTRGTATVHAVEVRMVAP